MQTAKKSTANGPPRRVTSPIPVLPPGAIPVKIVAAPNGEPLILMNTRTDQEAPAPAPSTPLGSISVTDSPRSSTKSSSAPKSSRRFISREQPHKSTKPTRGRIRTDAPAPTRTLWEAPITQNNVAKILRRVNCATDSLKLVLSTLHREIEKTQQYQEQIAIEKRGIVAVKLRTTIGAFKRQLREMEVIAAQTQRMDPYAHLLKPGQYKRPFTKQPPSKGGPKRPMTSSEVIELSDSSDEETPNTTGWLFKNVTMSSRKLSKD